MTEAVAIILAAGHSRRFGDDKRRLRLPDGQSMIESALLPYTRAGVAVIVVLRQHDPVAGLLVARTDLCLVEVPRDAQGMGDSLAAGAAAADDGAALMIGLADKPFLRPDTVSRVALLLQEHELVVPVHRSRPGHPVGFSPAWRAQLLALRGAQGARAIIRANQDRCYFLETDDAGVVDDIDTPAQLRALLQRRGLC